MVELGLENSKEVLHDTVIITIALSGHTLADTFVFQHLLVGSHLVLPPLIRVKDQLGIVRYLLESNFEHFSNRVETRTTGKSETNDFTIE